jgi:hypothetical protein
MSRNQIDKIESPQLAVLKAFEIQFNGKFAAHGCGSGSWTIRFRMKVRRQYQQDYSHI